MHRKLPEHVRPCMHKKKDNFNVIKKDCATWESISGFSKSIYKLRNYECLKQLVQGWLSDAVSLGNTFADSLLQHLCRWLGRLVFGGSFCARVHKIYHLLSGNLYTSSERNMSELRKPEYLETFIIQKCLSFYCILSGYSFAVQNLSCMTLHCNALFIRYFIHYSPLGQYLRFQAKQNVAFKDEDKLFWYA